MSGVAERILGTEAAYGSRMDWVLLGSVVSRKAAEKVQPRNWYYVTYRSPNWGIRVAEIFTLALYRAGR